MKLITRDTDYALRALCYMAHNKDIIISVSELVKDLKIPRPFLRKLLQKLNQKKVLKSYKGLGGGFSLAVRPEELFLTDLIKIFQGTLKMNECLFKKRSCPNVKLCPLHKLIADIEEDVLKKLRSVTVASLSSGFRKVGIYGLA